MKHDMTCGTCHRTWNDREHPTPGARCPFEHLHVHEERMPISASLYERFKFFHEHAGYVVGRSAETALKLARAEERAEREGLVFKCEDEDYAWDGEGPAPEYFLWCAVYENEKERFPLASLGGVALDSMRDPYLRVVQAELYDEAFTHLDAHRDHVATMRAEELASRATLAGPADHVLAHYLGTELLS